MLTWGASVLRALFQIDKQERLKVFLLGAVYFVLVASYTVVKDLKDSVFMAIVGRDAIPSAKLYTLLIFVPAILFYSRLVDRMRRYHLVYVYSFIYGIFGLVFAYFLGHSLIGLPNTNVSHDRIFGWVFYFFLEGYSPFLVGIFWAFANSINDPDSAKKNYPLMVSGSKIGGIAGGLLALTWLHASRPQLLEQARMQDIYNHQILLAGASASLLLIPVFVYLLIRYVPGRLLHGYEAAYRFEKERAQEVKKEGMFKSMVSGLTLFAQQPYMLGIFGMMFFYEIVYTVFSYQRLSVIESESKTLSDITASLIGQSVAAHVFGFIISLFITRVLLRFLGERFCLLLIPVAVGVMLLCISLSYTAHTIFVVFACLRALNYAFSKPIIETLYIPTIKELKFKSKSWIDSFGSKLSKSTGSSFNLFAERMGPALFGPLHAVLFIFTIGLWAFTAYGLGRRFDRAVKRNEVIGAEMVE